MDDKKTILVVDDASDVRKLLKFHLENKGYQVIEAQDGEEGLQMIHESRPDLVILDINMPKMSGIEVYKKLSVGTDRPIFPVLVLTVREELGCLFKDLDVDGFVTKPFEIEVILNNIDAIMEKRYGGVAEEKPKKTSGPKKILIIENDSDAFDKIVIAFLNAGFLVNSARSGMDAIEKIMVDLPDLIVVKLGLSDLSGDLLVAKLKQMPKTMDIPVVLYTPYSSSLDHVVVDKICEKINIKLVKSDSPDVLLKKAEEVL